MKKYALITNKETKQCVVGLGENIEYYKSCGMTETDVEQAYDGSWYVEGYAPEKPAETLKEKLVRLETEYQMPRYVREAILAEGSPYSDFTKARARELEDLAEQIRKETNNE